MAGAARGRWMLRMAGRLWWSPVVVVGVLVDRGSRARWLLTPGVVVLAASASTVGKLLFRRPRPGASTPIARAGRLAAAGFPSTHTACAFAIAGWQRDSRQRRWLHLVAIGVGYLRVRRRAHYRGDVAAGAALGYAIAWQIDGAWSRLSTLRAARSAERAGERRTITVSEPRPDHASVADHHHPSATREPLLASGRRGVSSRAAARRRSAGRPLKRLDASDSSQEVR